MKLFFVCFVSQTHIFIVKFREIKGEEKQHTFGLRCSLRLDYLSQRGPSAPHTFHSGHKRAGQHRPQERPYIGPVQRLVKRLSFADSARSSWRFARWYFYLCTLKWQKNINRVVDSFSMLSFLWFMLASTIVLDRLKLLLSAYTQRVKTGNAGLLDVFLMLNGKWSCEIAYEAYPDFRHPFSLLETQVWRTTPSHSNLVDYE